MLINLNCLIKIQFGNKKDMKTVRKSEVNSIKKTVRILQKLLGSENQNPALQRHV